MDVADQRLGLFGCADGRWLHQDVAGQGLILGLHAGAALVEQLNDVEAAGALDRIRRLANFQLQRLIGKEARQLSGAPPP